jgi:hypothetical protein
MYQNSYEKIAANIVRLFINCPYFLLEKICFVIFSLLLQDRKMMDIYLKIR